jgi:tetratricopeptide (TPR) repeat protein
MAQSLWIAPFLFDLFLDWFMSKRVKNKLASSSGKVNSLDKLRHKAISLYQAKRVNELELVCKKILRKKPDDAYANYLLGLSLHDKGESVRAASLYKKAAEIDNENKVFVLAAANTLSYVGRHDEAVMFFKKFLQFQPDSEVYNKIGFLYASMGRVKNAIPYYKKALESNSGNVEALNNMGNAFQELGKKGVAATFYKRAIDQKPGFAVAYYNLHAVQFRDDDPAPAIESLSVAIAADSKHMEAKAYLAMLLNLKGKDSESNTLFAEVQRDAAQFSFLQESWEYIKSHRTQNTRIFSLTFDSLRYAFSCANNTGMILEFGVRYGTTINFIASLTDKGVDGFDSFEGIPEQWKTEQKGRYTTYGELPPVYSNVTLHQGWFDKTLPGFCAGNTSPVRFMNIDCDLYSSTRIVFEQLGSRIKSGTVIVFDEYICNPQWQDDEFRAFQEHVKKYNLEYEYLLFSPFSKQAAVIIK